MRKLLDTTGLHPHGWRPSGDSTLKVIVLIIIPAALFIPILYYSLTTPFALVDDYYDWTWVEVIESPRLLAQWFYERFIGFEYIGSRYRPFFELYNMLAWKLFGPVPWLHHLGRWALHFAAVAAFSAAFLSFSRDRRDHVARLVPFAVLLYVWLFFPNSPASRLAPQEVHTVLFLGLCNLAMALAILGNDRDRGPTGLVLARGMLLLGFVGLSISKETNIGVMAWILAFYIYHVLSRSNRSSGELIIAAFLCLVLTYMFAKVYVVHQVQGYGYGTLDLSLARIVTNFKLVLGGLFQVKTSFFVISLGFMSLCVLLLVNLAAALRRRLDAQSVFVIFLLGQAVCMFLVLAVAVSWYVWGAALRYWYVLVPIFATLMAFVCKYLLDGGVPRMPRRAVVAVLAVFVTYFVGANYYNFLEQTAVQHDTRRVESDLIAAIVELHERDLPIHRLHCQRLPTDLGLPSVSPGNAAPDGATQVLLHRWRCRSSPGTDVALGSGYSAAFLEGRGRCHRLILPLDDTQGIVRGSPTRRVVASRRIDSLVTRAFRGWVCGVRAVRREGFGCSGWGLCCGR